MNDQIIAVNAQQGVRFTHTQGLVARPIFLRVVDATRTER